MKRIKLGVVANEFFDLDRGRMGGFGWAARQIARVFQDTSLGVDVVYLTGELRATLADGAASVHGTRLLLRQPSLIRDIRQTRAEDVDLLLLIDYRPNYQHVCWTLPRTPMIVWVRDPRPPDDVQKVHGLRIPGAHGTRAKGTFQPGCASLGSIVRASRWLRRPVLFASPAPHLRHKASATFKVDVGELPLLPNPVELTPGQVHKSERPHVVFLARRRRRHREVPRRRLGARVGRPGTLAGHRGTSPRGRARAPRSESGADVASNPRGGHHGPRSPRPLCPRVPPMTHHRRKSPWPG